MKNNEQNVDTRSTTINKIMNSLYQTKHNLILKKSEIKKIESYYKANYRSFTQADEFLGGNVAVSALLGRTNSAYDEVIKQLSIGRALQPGILFECVLSQSLAHIFGLSNYMNLQSMEYLQLAQDIFSNYGTLIDINKARYIYFSLNDEKKVESALIQQGSPDTCDALWVSDGVVLKLEFKDVPALLLDVDLIYDDQGKIVIDDNILENHPYCAQILTEFNKTNTIFEYFSNNIKLSFDHNERVNLINKFIQNKNIDMLITANKQNNIIGMEPSDFNLKANGKYLISTYGSEIRTTGKNHRTHAFTKEFLDDSLSELGVEKFLRNGQTYCRVHKENTHVVGPIIGRGKNEITRFKLSPAFFLRWKDVTMNGDYIEFMEDAINQSKMGISVHINIELPFNDVRYAIMSSNN